MKSPAEAVQSVLANRKWMDDSARCPAAVMRKKAGADAIADVSCGGRDVTACFARCRAGEANACYRLAYELQQANLEESAYAALYQRSCILGEASGCTNRAAGMLNVRPKNPDVRQCAAQTFTRTCALEDAWGCTMRGSLLYAGIGVEKNAKLALEALDKGCEYSDETHEACKSAERLKEQIALEAAEKN